MAKKTGSVWDNTIEQLEQLGKSTVKQTVSSLKQTFSPTSLIEHVTGQSAEQHHNGQKMEQQRKDKNSTPLDLLKLEDNYADQDKQKADSIRHRYFQRVKGDEEKILQIKQQEKQQQKQQLIYDKQEKDRKQQQKQQVAPGEAEGRQRGHIGQARRKAHVPDPTEMKPNSGKN